MSDRPSLLRRAVFARIVAAGMILAGAGAILALWRRRRPSSAEQGWERRAAVAALVAMIVALHVLLTRIIAWYYATFLPHYDSVGMYTVVARIMGFVRAGRWSDALDVVAHVDVLGWLAPFFGVVAGLVPFIEADPAGQQWLNTLCVGAFAGATALAARQLGATWGRAVLLAMVVLLPDTVTNWDGGYQDMRRDSQFLPLLGATFFLLHVHLWSPRRLTGIALGVLAGLTLWSRSEAVVYLGAIGAPIVAARILRTGWRPTLGILAVPLGVGGVLGVPFLATAGVESAVRRRRLTEMFSSDVSAWDSLAYYWDAPFRLWTTAAPNVGASATTQALGILQALVLLAGMLALFGLPRRPASAVLHRAGELLAGGLWAMAATYLLICVAARFRPGFEWAGYPPFYPALLGLFALALVIGTLATGDRLGRWAALRWIGVAAVIAVSVVLFAGRVRLRAPAQAETAALADARRVLDTIAAGPRDAVLAILSHDRINDSTLTFLAVQHSPDLPFERFRWHLPSGRLADFGYRLPPGADPAEYQRSLLTQLRRRADWLIVNEDPAAYARATAWDLFLFQQGRPVVEALLDDPAMERVASYTLTQGGGTPRRFVLLRNTRIAQ